jgi:hypothetical protein
MDPFNIKITLAEQAITLTILPVNTEMYKVVYFGGILGVIRRQSDQYSWESVPTEELLAGDLPFYQRTLNSDHQLVELDARTIEQIGQAINQEQSLQPKSE